VESIERLAPNQLNLLAIDSAISEVKRVAIVQSNYLPWKGYFDLIASVDEFVLYDSVQYTRRDWRNRNKIKTHNGLRWITVPVRVKGKYLQSIAETELAEEAWSEEHLSAIRHAYARTPAFTETFSWLEQQFLSAPKTTISALNRHLIEACCFRLGIQTRIRSSDEFTLSDGKSERLADICRDIGANEYVSGPAARAYLDEAIFAERNVAVRWKSYAGYPTYDQPEPPFEHAVSVIDLMFCTGSSAPAYMRSPVAFAP
jgi:hypothetical protein